MAKRDKADPAKGTDTEALVTADVPADPLAAEPLTLEEPMRVEDTAEAASSDPAPAEAVLDAPASEDTDATPDTATEPVEVPRPTDEPRRDPPPPVRSGSGFFGFVTGGILAAVIGFAAARYVLPEDWPVAGGSSDRAALEQQVADQAATIAALGEEIDALRAAPPPAPSVAPEALDALRDDLATRMADTQTALDQGLRDIGDRIAGLDARLSEVEKRPVDGGGVSEAAIAAYTRELDALKAELEAQRAATADLAGSFDARAAEAEARLAEAQAQAAEMRAAAEAESAAASLRAALGQVQAALETGSPFAGPLDDLTAAGVTVPDPLASVAADGAPTLAALQRSFPEAARAAIEASVRANMGDSWTDRAAAFFQVQTGARSLTPRDGSDPDAILSRAEAALADGQIQTALDEVATLPPEGQDAMADWAAQARARLAAIDAAAALAADLNNR